MLTNRDDVYKAQPSANLPCTCSVSDLVLSIRHTEKNLVQVLCHVSCDGAGAGIGDLKSICALSS